MITLALFGLAALSSAAPNTPMPEGADAVYKALSARDGAPSCEAVEALSAEPVAALLFVAENATQPPWAGIRAAECLVQRHAAEVQPTLERWVSTSETRGFGLIAINQLEQMPAPVALSVARIALSGPLAEDARPRLLAIQNPELRALVE